MSDTIRTRAELVALLANNSAGDISEQDLRDWLFSSYTAAELNALLSAKASSSHTHSNATTSAAGFESAADKSKLDGIATSATANATDANLRDRSTHTGVQAISTVTSLQATLDAKVSLSGGTMSGVLALGGHNVTGVADIAFNGLSVRNINPSGAIEVNFSTGGGFLDMGNGAITNVQNLTANDATIHGVQFSAFSDYVGDNFSTISNLAQTASDNADNAVSIANSALPLSGGTMAGSVDWGGYDITNSSNFYTNYIGDKSTAASLASYDSGTGWVLTANQLGTNDGQLLMNADINMQGLGIVMSGGSITGINGGTYTLSIAQSGLDDSWGLIDSGNDKRLVTIGDDGRYGFADNAILVDGSNVVLGLILDMGGNNITGVNTLDMGGGYITDVNGIAFNSSFSGVISNVSNFDNPDSAPPIFNQGVDCNGILYITGNNTITGESYGGGYGMLLSSDTRIKLSGPVDLGVSTYEDNDAAILGGLSAGTVYATSTGELRVLV